jgi:hypothetical protein
MTVYGDHPPLVSSGLVQLINPGRLLPRKLPQTRGKTPPVERSAVEMIF